MTKYYKVIWTDLNGCRCSRPFDTEREAGAFYSQLRRDGIPSAAMWEVRQFA